MACQWRQVATGRNRHAASDQTIADLAKRATAEAEIEPVLVQLPLTDRCWKIKTLHTGGGGPPGKQAADTGRLCQEGISAWSVFLLVFQSRP